VQLDFIALVISTGFVTAIVSAGALLYTIVAEDRGVARQLQRRLAPSDDLPHLSGREAIARTVAQGLTPLVRLARPKDDEFQHLREKLTQAGLRGAATSQIVLAAKAALALLGAGLVLAANEARPGGLPFPAAWAVALAGAGFFLPNAWLDRRVRARQAALDRALPDAMDLLVTSVEAGLGVDAALQRVSAEMTMAQPALAEELTLTFLEVKAGVSRSEAFRRLSARTGVQDLRTLAATLAQTDTFGTSVVGALRIHSDGMRARRLQRAEERAQKLSVKMTLPLVVCFLPALAAVLVGPAVVNIVVQLARGIR
jgi:tight adherence protein C